MPRQIPSPNPSSNRAPVSVAKCIRCSSPVCQELSVIKITGFLIFSSCNSINILRIAATELSFSEEKQNTVAGLLANFSNQITSSLDLEKQSNITKFKVLLKKSSVFCSGFSDFNF